MTFPYAFPITALITLASLIFYIWTALRVGRARFRLNVPAPRMDGPEEFMRLYRIQANTVEQLVLFLPLLWLSATLAGDAIAAAIGGFWPLGRALYAVGYLSAPKKRFTGFLLNLIVYVALIATSLICLYQSVTYIP